MVKELLMAPAVPHVSLTIAVRVQGRERWGKNTVVDGLVVEPPNDLDTVPLIYRIPIAQRLV